MDRMARDRLPVDLPYVDRMPRDFEEMSGRFEEAPERNYGSSYNGEEDPFDEDFVMSEELLVSWKEKLTEYRKTCIELNDELIALDDHFTHIGGNSATTAALNVLHTKLLEHVGVIEGSYLRLDYGNVERRELSESLVQYRNLVINLHKSLYHRRHAFYFREVKKWEKHLKDGTKGYDEMNIGAASELGRLIRMNQQRLFESFIPDLQYINEEVIKELQTFARTTMSSFLTNEEENAKALYDASMTTIATFFSSVTATTLQFSYSQGSSKFGSAVNLFWFLSLVFSVSSGVNSLMGMAWRKSSIYSTYTPPMLLKVWLDKSPMVCLIISALTFVAGLNVFVYLSIQPLFVSLSTNLFSGLHVFCLLVVTTWFISRLKRNSKWVCAITSFLLWISHPKQQYRKNRLHWLRNVYWAFGSHVGVADINQRLYRDSDWPGPCLLAQLVRPVAAAVGKIASGVKLVSRFVVRSVCKLLCGDVICSNGDPENGKPGIPWARLRRRSRSNNTLDYAMQAKLSFVDQLQQTFSDHYLLELIVEAIEDWENDYWERKYAADLNVVLERLLWGYPHFVESFRQRCYNAVTSNRNKTKDRLRRERLELEARRLERERLEAEARKKEDEARKKEDGKRKQKETRYSSKATQVNTVIIMQAIDEFLPSLQLPSKPPHSQKAHGKDRYYSYRYADEKSVAKPAEDEQPRHFPRVFQAVTKGHACSLI